jgi:hypothetical protein
MPAQVGVSFFQMHATPFEEDKFHLIMCPPNTMNNLCWCFKCREKPQGSSRGCSEFLQDARKNLGIFGNFYSAQEDYKKVEFFAFLPLQNWAA